MLRKAVLAATALFGGSLLAPQASAQQAFDVMGGLTLTTTPAIVSDYSFRGISQTRNRPAAQLALDLEHASGFYVGAFVSNVAFLGTNARQEVDGLAGYRFALGALKLDIGGVYYGYPGYDGPLSLAWWEAVAKASYEIAPLKFVAMVAYSPDFNLESGTGIYVEGGLDVALDFGFTLSGRIGYQWVDDNARFGAEDYTNVSISVSREIFAGFVGTVSGVFTSLDRRSDCFGGQKICDNRVILGISRPF